MKAFFCLIQLSLHGIIHNIVFFDNRFTFFVCLCCSFLMFPDIVNLISQCGNNTNGTGTIQPHVIKHLHHDRRVLFPEVISQSEDGSVGILFYEFRKLLNVFSCYLGELSRVRLHLGKHITKCGSGHFITEQVFIHDGTEAHDLSLCQSERLTKGSYSGSKVHKVSGFCCRVLCKLIDGRSSLKHCIAKTMSIILSKCHCQFTHLVNGSLSQVITQRDLNHIGCFNKLFNLIFRCDT